LRKKLHVKNDVMPDLAVHHFSLRQNGTPTWVAAPAMPPPPPLLLLLLKRLHLLTATVL
jgi:hypothetical protein